MSEKVRCGALWTSLRLNLQQVDQQTLSLEKQCDKQVIRTDGVRKGSMSGY